MANNGTCCSGQMNLQKMDPVTGSIIWRRAIAFDVNSPQPIGGVEKIPTTTDILISSSGTSTSGGGIAKVNSSGHMYWKIHATQRGLNPGSFRTFGADQFGNVIFNTVIGSAQLVKSFAVGDDPNTATPLWTKTFSGVVATVIVTGRSALIWENNNPGLGTPFYTWDLDTVTGATNWSTPSAGLPADGREPSGIYFQNNSTFSGPAKRVAQNTTTTTFVETATGTGWFGQNVARYSAGIYVGGCVDPFNKVYLIATSGNTIVPAFKTNIITGTIFQVLNPIDACSIVDPTAGRRNIYVGGLVWANDQVHEYSIMATNSTGAVIWLQRFSTGKNSGGHSVRAVGCDISTDGYLYVGGLVGTY